MHAEELRALHRKIVLLQIAGRCHSGRRTKGAFDDEYYHRPVGDRMVIAGIGWEFVEELARRGFAEIPDMDAPYRVHWQYGVSR